MPQFSRDLERTLQSALLIAGERGSEATLVHLALALTEDVFIGAMLRACAVERELRRMAGPVLDGRSTKESKPDAVFNRAFQRAVISAQSAGRDRLDSPHLFLALIEEADNALSTNALSTMLSDVGVRRYDVVRHVTYGIRKMTPEEGGAAESGDRNAPFVVKLFNDDCTPMELVVSTLRDTFDHSQDDAVRRMLEIHQRGTAECDTYPLDVAAAEVAAVEKLARDCQHPLHCVMEPREV